MAATQEPLLSRIDRLDHLLRNLEEIRVGNKSPRSSSPSTPTSGTDGRASSLEFSPRSRDKYHHCRSIDEAIVEMEHKGSLLERVALMEDRLLEVCTRVEMELDAERHEREDKNQTGGGGGAAAAAAVAVADHKGLKQLLKSCVKGKSKSKSKSKPKHKS